MSNLCSARPVIRASVAGIAASAEFLSQLFDAPTVITYQHDALPEPAEQRSEHGWLSTAEAAELAGIKPQAMNARITGGSRPRCGPAPAHRRRERG